MAQKTGMDRSGRMERVSSYGLEDWCGLAETVWIMGIGDHAWVQGMDLGLTAWAATVYV